MWPTARRSSAPSEKKPAVSISAPSSPTSKSGTGRSVAIETTPSSLRSARRQQPDPFCREEGGTGEGGRTRGVNQLIYETRPWGWGGGGCGGGALTWAISRR